MPREKRQKRDPSVLSDSVSETPGFPAAPLGNHAVLDNFTLPAQSFRSFSQPQKFERVPVRPVPPEPQVIVIVPSVTKNPLSALPPDALTDLFELYFEYFNAAIPIIHKQSFMQNWRTESPLLLNAMCALSARYSNHPSVLRLADGENVRQNLCEMFYFEARDMADQYTSCPKASTVAAFLMLKDLSDDWLAGFPAVVETPLMQEQKRAQIRDFNSTTVFIRPTLSSFTPPDCSTCFIYLSKIFGHIVDFTKQYNTNTSPTGTSSIQNSHSPSPTIDLDLRLSLLETSLVSWYASLPEPIRTPLSPTMTPPDHFCAIANLQIYYHLCMMILHKPNLMHTLRTYPPKTHHTTIPHTRSFQTCHRAAQQITRLVYTLRHNNNSQWTHMGAPLTCCYAVFQGALVFLIAGQVYCGGGGGLEAARVHVEALRGLAKDWALAGKLGETLNGLIE
ncbi:hypothetical protein HDU98_003846, partial [Podochytrium sp. JEL0797]